MCPSKRYRSSRRRIGWLFFIYIYRDLAVDLARNTVLRLIALRFTGACLHYSFLRRYSRRICWVSPSNVVVITKQRLGYYPSYDRIDVRVILEDVEPKYGLSHVNLFYCFGGIVFILFADSESMLAFPAQLPLCTIFLCGTECWC